MTTRRERWDKEARRLENTVASGNPSSIKGARTRFENAHREYWNHVHEAVAEIKAAGSDANLTLIADKHGVEVRDIGEVLR